MAKAAILSKKQSQALAARAREVVKRLRRLYPRAHCTLDHRTPYQLLVATVLSAQCTDKRVNQLTPQLFRKYAKPQDYLDVPISEIEADIRPTGFFRAKAKSLRGIADTLTREFHGAVPESMETLTRLPGVGRKTASVILGNAFGVPAFPVDTHVKRVSHRLGLTPNTNPDKIERDLCALVDRRDWTEASHLLIFHGREICKALKPRCADCRLEELCPSSLLKGPPH